MKAAIWTILSPLVLWSCTVIPAAPPRPPLPLPEEVASRFLPDGNPPQVEILEREKTKEYDLERGEFRGEDGNRVPFQIYRPRREGPFPFVMALPILHGNYIVPKLLCRNLARRGIAAGYLERPCEILAAHQTAADLETLFRVAVRRYRTFLHWVARDPGIDGNQIGIAGVSMGAFVGINLAAVEPLVKRSFLIMPGCTLSQILLISNEEKILEYMALRQKYESLTPEEISLEFEQDFVSDPAHLAPHVDSRGVVMATARYDGVIPPVISDRIWDLLGRPERIKLPTGHYTALLTFPYLMGKMEDHFREMPDFDPWPKSWLAVSDLGEPAEDDSASPPADNSPSFTR